MKKASAKKPVRVGMISLGCAKNLVDAEVMLGTLLKEGFEITNAPVSADALLINTCSFIGSAQEESVDTILESMEVREANARGQALVVAGCLSQRFRTELPGLLPEVDAFIGIDQVTQVGSVVREAVSRRLEKLQSPPVTNQKRGGDSGSALGGKAGREGQDAKRRRDSKGRLLGKIAELEAGKSPDSGPELRGTAAFGKTRVVAKDAPTRPTGPLLDVTERPKYIPDYGTPRFRLTPRHFAYLKIAEGCNHPCSFCIIPQMRGSHRSRTQADVVAEAKALLKDGVKELNLISQDSTYYGLDLRQNHSRAIASPDRFNAAVSALPANATTISTLLRELNDLPGDFWIRLLYTHPAHWTDELIRTMAECPKVARYVDIPLQHIHENMIERMRRETSREYIEDLIKRIRAGIPGIALRTTFIVGFPGETERSFESLLDFMQTTRFERLGVFVYSREEGTRAGGMSGQVSQAVKLRRRDEAMAVQQKISEEIGRQRTGEIIRVLVESQASEELLRKADVSSWEHGLIRADDHTEHHMRGKVYIGRGEADAPDIDGRVYVSGRCRPGEFAQVRITGCTDYDLMAKVV
jgi:ribosomal protein S12 methylthiotransferase